MTTHDSKHLSDDEAAPHVHFAIIERPVPLNDRRPFGDKLFSRGRDFCHVLGGTIHGKVAYGKQVRPICLC